MFHIPPHLFKNAAISHKDRIHSQIHFPQAIKLRYDYKGVETRRRRTTLSPKTLGCFIKCKYRTECADLKIILNAYSINVGTENIYAHW